MKKIIYLTTASLVAMLILASAALAQDAVPGDDDPLSPEQNVVVLESDDELEKTVGKQIPQQMPDEPIDEPGGPAPTTSGALPSSGGLEPGSLLLPAAALLLGSGVLSYAVLRRRR